MGLWLCVRTLRPARGHDAPDGPSPPAITALAVVGGMVGGMYGIGGGSLLGPILVGRGLPVTKVAPAALATTFITSTAGALTYAVLALSTPGDIAPEWGLGLLCGLGGLIGGYVGAHLQPRLPETALRLLLGALATALAGLYAVQALTDLTPRPGGAPTDRPPRCRSPPSSAWHEHAGGGGRFRSGMLLPVGRVVRVAEF
ncbi:TSUP family transporter [Nonomuraea rosea]|uniref:TSUP family transporter n=1 Tax=Nonomuraea rosea TaxID=638574 RepID=UPI0031E839E6